MFDLNGDGRVSPEEIVTGYYIMDVLDESSNKGNRDRNNGKSGCSGCGCLIFIIILSIIR